MKLGDWGEALERSLLFGSCPWRLFYSVPIQVQCLGSDIRQLCKQEEILVQEVLSDPMFTPAVLVSTCVVFSEAIMSGPVGADPRCP